MDKVSEGLPCCLFLSVTFPNGKEKNLCTFLLVFEGFVHDPFSLCLLCGRVFIDFVVRKFRFLSSVHGSSVRLEP